MPFMSGFKNSQLQYPPVPSSYEHMEFIIESKLNKLDQIFQIKFHCNILQAIICTLLYYFVSVGHRLRIYTVCPTWEWASDLLVWPTYLLHLPTKYLAFIWGDPTWIEKSSTRKYASQRLDHWDTHLSIWASETNISGNGRGKTLYNRRYHLLWLDVQALGISRKLPSEPPEQNMDCQN